MAGFSLYIDKVWKQTISDRDNFTEVEKTVAERIGEARGLQIVFEEVEPGDINDKCYRLIEDSSSPRPATCLLEFLIQKEIIRVTEEEILDRSKTDTISKVVVVGQTLWFVAQCVARAAEKLPVTNLEIMTLAFAALNIATYFMWWNKPQRVRYPIMVNISEGRNGLLEKNGHRSEETSESTTRTEIQASEDSSDVACNITGEKSEQGTRKEMEVSNTGGQSSTDDLQRHWRPLRT
ncbi:hypothetical protein VKT23_012975 [Stygiomarasmius scandens]|uniref:Uncharacterized protein n=1 Tax=Marasmiellus scandens TaxID=2682957 RepID=A0ABR1J6X4_9AGAR